jgi:hypothetical protein
MRAKAERWRRLKCAEIGFCREISGFRFLGVILRHRMRRLGWRSLHNSVAKMCNSAPQAPEGMASFLDAPLKRFRASQATHAPNAGVAWCDVILPGLACDFVKRNRLYFHPGDLVRIHDLDSPDFLFKNEPSIRAYPGILASSDIDRVTTDSMDRKRPPIFGSQKFPDPVRHMIRLSPKNDSHKRTQSSKWSQILPSRDLPPSQTTARPRSEVT